MRGVGPALAVWLAGAALAVAAFRFGPLVGLTIAGAVGLLFGWIAARGVDARRTRVRVRRGRRRSRRT